jgi:hypothetical protein
MVLISGKEGIKRKLWWENLFKSVCLKDKEQKGRVVRVGGGWNWLNIVFCHDLKSKCQKGQLIYW